jgi:tetratricopeptide (TPR) repeat protein
MSLEDRPKDAEVEIRRGLMIRRKLADDHPDVTDFYVGLAGSHSELSVRLTLLGRPEEAEAELHAAISVGQGLLSRGGDPGRAHAILAPLHHGVGRYREQAGDRDGAIGHDRESVRLNGDRPGPAIFELGRLLGDADRHDEAIAVYRRVIAIDASEPRGPSGLAGALLRVGRPAEAVGAGRDALRLLERIAAAEPGKAEHRDDLAGALLTLGDALRCSGSSAEARIAYDRTVAIREALIEEHPNDPKCRSHLAWSLSRRGLTRGALGDPAGAAEDARHSLALYDGLPSRSGEEWFQTACVHAALATLARRDRPSSPADRAASESETAMALLFKAAGMGYRDRDAYRTEAALNNLRDRDDFRALMMDLAMPSDPFAAGG